MQVKFLTRVRILKYDDPVKRSEWVDENAIRDLPDFYAQSLIDSNLATAVFEIKDDIFLASDGHTKHIVFPGQDDVELPVVIKDLTGAVSTAVVGRGKKKKSG